MSYLSLPFGVFVAVLLVAYYLLPAKCRGGLLLVASVGFYALFDWRYLAFLLAVALSTYLCAGAMPKRERKKLLLMGCAVFNGAVWFAVKVLPQGLGNLAEGWIVPVGLSYYVLQAVGYLVDVYRGRIAPEKKLWKYVLFLSWFPAIVQGPISRYDELGPQLTANHRLTYDGLVDNGTLVLIGLVKKLVVADRLAILVNSAFAGYATLEGLVLYLGAVGYAFQLYLDFSGCVDICRGVSGLFGIRLAENFNAPYRARSIREFWGRWHMSLSRWLKDYIYIPLGGNRKGVRRKYINLLAVFAVSGIWHGAGPTFLAWGLMQGVYQIIGERTAPWRAKVRKAVKLEPGSSAEALVQMVVTFHLTVVSWVVFRSETLGRALIYFIHMMIPRDLLSLFSGSTYALGVGFPGMVLLAVHIFLLMWLEAKGLGQEQVVARIRGLWGPLRWAVYLMLVFDVLLFGAYGSGYSMAGFLYGGF